MASDSPADCPETPPKKRKWRRRLTWLAFLVVGAAWWINGPGFRWCGEWALSKALGVEGDEGALVLEGTLWRGPELGPFLWRDSQGIEVRGKVAQVRYEPWRLLRGGVPAVLRSLAVKDLHVEVDLREPRETPAKEEAPDSDAKRGFPWPRLPQPSLEIENLNVEILLPESRRVSLQGFHGTVTQGSEAGRLGWSRLALPDGQEWAEVEGNLTYTDTGLRLGGLALGNALRLQGIEVSVNEAQRLELASEVRVCQSDLQVEAELGRWARLSLGERALDLHEVAQTWMPDLPLGGELTQVALQIENMERPLSEWKVTSEIHCRQPSFGAYQVESIHATLVQSDTQARLEFALALDAENRLQGHAQTEISDENEAWERLPWEAALDVMAPRLGPWFAQSGLPPVLSTLSGRVEVVGTAAEVDRLGGGLEVGTLSWDPWSLPPMRLALGEGQREGGPGHTVQLSSEEGWIEGTLSLAKDWETYSGTLRVGEVALEAWQSSEAPPEFRGGLQVEWSGQGRMTGEPAHAGRVKALAEGLTVKALGEPLEARVEAAYDLPGVTLDVMEVGFRDLALRAQAAASTSSLQVTEWTLDRGEQRWLEGEVDLPLATEGESFLDRLWGASDPVKIAIQSVPLGLQELLQVAGKPMELEGDVRLEGQFAGPAKSLEGTLRVTGQGLGKTEAAGWPATADAEVSFSLEDGRAALRGEVRHANLEPILLEASLPLSLERVAEVPEAELTGRVRVPPTALDFLPEFVSALKTSQGELAADVEVSGLVQAPSVTGTVRLDAPLITFSDPGLPKLESTKVVVSGNQSRITIEEVSTTNEGGTLELKGTVDLSEAQPGMDVRAVARQALLSRNENMVVRANADLRLLGPWSAAALSGEVGVVESRYFQEIELIPTNRPTTSLPSSPMEVRDSYGTEAEPFRDWEIDVRLVTDEPFRVRTNLAAADVELDLRLAGTGASVKPLGVVDLNDAYAQLPFSRLDLQQSAIRFTEASGTAGVLDIRGESLIRDYQTRMVVQGSLNDARYVLTSNPPLPEEEIMALLVTGTMREDLVGSSQAVASRAALLLFDKIWRKIAKKDWEDPDAMRKKRVTFETGHVNPRTGSTMTTARLRLTDQWSLTGDADVEGEFRGLLHYVLSF